MKSPTSAFTASTASAGPPNRIVPTTIDTAIVRKTIHESLPCPLVFIVLLLRRGIPAPAPDCSLWLTNVDLNRSPAAVTFGVRRGVADDVTAAKALDNPRVVVPQARDIVRKIR